MLSYYTVTIPENNLFRSARCYVYYSYGNNNNPETGHGETIPGYYFTVELAHKYIGNADPVRGKWYGKHFLIFPYVYTNYLEECLSDYSKDLERFCDTVADDFDRYFINETLKDYNLPCIKPNDVKLGKYFIYDEMKKRLVKQMINFELQFGGDEAFMKQLFHSDVPLAQLKSCSSFEAMFDLLVLNQKQRDLYLDAYRDFQSYALEHDLF